MISASDWFIATDSLSILAANNGRLEDDRSLSFFDVSHETILVLASIHQLRFNGRLLCNDLAHDHPGTIAPANRLAGHGREVLNGRDLHRIADAGTFRELYEVR